MSTNTEYYDKLKRATEGVSMIMSENGKIVPRAPEDVKAELLFECAIICRRLTIEKAIYELDLLKTSFGPLSNQSENVVALHLLNQKMKSLQKELDKINKK